MSLSHRELIENLVDMINRHDVSKIDLHVAPGYLDHNPAAAGNGIDINRAFWIGVFEAFPDLTTTVLDLVIEGDRIAGRLEFTGTHHGTFFGVPATGRPVSFETLDIWRVQDGLLAEHWDQLDVGDILRQLGVGAEPATAEAASAQ